MTVGRSGDEATLLRVSCPHCEDYLELPAREVRLTVGRSARTTFYSFSCAHCGAAVRKPAGERIVQLLSEAGVATMRLHVGR